jgi:hypothetical protein
VAFVDPDTVFMSVDDQPAAVEEVREIAG